MKRKFMCLILVILLLLNSPLQVRAEAERFVYPSTGTTVALNISYMPFTNYIKMYFNCYGSQGYYKWNNGTQVQFWLAESNGTPNKQVGATWESTEKFYTNFTGLMGNNGYLLEISQVQYSTYTKTAGLSPPYESSYILYTEPYVPDSLNFPTVGTNNLLLSWNNYNNAVDTNYTVQRKLTSGGGWTNITAQAGISQYNDTGLAQDTSYDYRIRVNAKNGLEYYSSIVTMTTTADPAVAAANAAKVAAESTLQNSIYAKVAAQNAEIAAKAGAIDSNYIRNEMLSVSGGIVQDASGTVLVAARNASVAANDVKNILNDGTNGLVALNNRLTNMNTSINNNLTDILNQVGNTTPVFTSLAGFNNATCTTNGSFKIVVGSQGATQYRAYTDTGVDSGWGNSNIIIINGLSPGTNTVIVQIKNDGGETTSKSMTVYSI